jgi:hypothetical protein
MNVSDQTSAKRTPIERWLAHPIVLLIVGALISNLLIPQATRQWQVDQKQLDIKTSLVSQISELATRFVMTVQFAEMGARSLSQADYDASFREWEIKQSIVASLLEAYFPNTSISNEWKDYCKALTQLYALSGTSNTDARKAELETIQVYLSEITLDWDVLRNTENRLGNWMDYQQAWGTLKDQLMLKKDEIVATILNTQIAPLI